jgi:UBX domain-containing protein 6
MASAIKKFFEKKKLDVKFKKAGSGHVLTEDTRSKGASSSNAAASRPSSSAPTASQRMAAQAALMRNQNAATRGNGSFVSHLFCTFRKGCLTLLD